MINKNDDEALKELILEVVFKIFKERDKEVLLIIVPFQQVIVSGPFLICMDIVLYFLDMFQSKTNEGEISDSYMSFLTY